MRDWILTNIFPTRSISVCNHTSRSTIQQASAKNIFWLARVRHFSSLLPPPFPPSPPRKKKEKRKRINNPEVLKKKSLYIFKLFLFHFFSLFTQQSKPFSCSLSWLSFFICFFCHSKIFHYMREDIPHSSSSLLFCCCCRNSLTLSAVDDFILPPRPPFRGGVGVGVVVVAVWSSSPDSITVDVYNPPPPPL